MDNLINLIIQAREEAIERGIQANSVVISDKLRYVESFRFIDKFTDGSISMTTFKPMICGLEIDIKKLPANLDFVVYEADETFNGKLKAQIRKDTAKEIWRDLMLSFTSIGNGQMVIDEKDFIKVMRNYGVEVNE